jgi:hypothetical protein
VQLVGTFSFAAGELAYTIERRSSEHGTSTTLRFLATLGGSAGSAGRGTLEFALQRKSGGESGTVLSIESKYSGRFRNGTLILGFVYNQQTMTGTGTVREFAITGQLQHKGGTAFAWAVKMGGGTTTIALAASNLKLGAVTADTSVTLKMKDGSVQSVQVFVGLTIPKKQ